MSDSYQALGSSLRITALSIQDVAKVLSRTGNKPLTEEMIREDIAEGAPMNADGTMNLLAYAAWLAREVGNAD